MDKQPSNQQSVDDTKESDEKISILKDRIIELETRLFRIEIILWILVFILFSFLLAASFISIRVFIFSN